MIDGADGGLSQGQEKWEVSRMSRQPMVGMVAGAMMMLALVSAACSGGTPNEAPPPDSENVKVSIKVYENPT